MSEIIDSTAEDITEKKEFSIVLKISDQNLSYKSDFSESETVFWLEAVKNIILKNAFDRVESA